MQKNLHVCVFHISPKGKAGWEGVRETDRPGRRAGQSNSAGRSQNQQEIQCYEMGKNVCITCELRARAHRGKVYKAE